MNITKKLMIAAGLFFQLSNLQAEVSPEMKKAIDGFGGVENIQAKSMDPGMAKKKANANGGSKEDLAVALYVSSGPSSTIKGTFDKSGGIAATNQDNAKASVQNALDELNGKKAEQAETTTQQAQDESNVNPSKAVGNQDQTNDLQEELANAQAQISNLKSQAEANKQSAAQEAQKQINAAQAQAKKDIAQAQADAKDNAQKAIDNCTQGDKDIEALKKELADAKDDANKKNDAYVKLATKAAQSLQDAVISISDEKLKNRVQAAVQQVMSPSAAVPTASSKHSRNLGRLGSKKNHNKA